MAQLSDDCFAFGGALMAVNTIALMTEALVERRDIRSLGGIASTD